MRGSYCAVATAGTDALEDAGAACGTELSGLSAGAGPGGGPCGGAPGASPGGDPAAVRGSPPRPAVYSLRARGTLAACGANGWPAPGGAGGGEPLADPVPLRVAAVCPRWEQKCSVGTSCGHRVARPARQGSGRTGRGRARAVSWPAVGRVRRFDRSPRLVPACPACPCTGRCGHPAPEAVNPAAVCSTTRRGCRWWWCRPGFATRTAEGNRPCTAPDR